MKKQNGYQITVQSTFTNGRILTETLRNWDGDSTEELKEKAKTAIIDRAEQYVIWGLYTEVPVVEVLSIAPDYSKRIKITEADLH